jgi:signal transduction histidine kinase
VSRPPSQGSSAGEPSEWVSLVERMGALSVLRGGFAAVVLTVGLLDPGVRGVAIGLLALATALYLSTLALPLAVRRLSRGAAVFVCGASLLVDGVYLTWAAYATGGVESPLRFLLFVQVVAVTLVASYRTGLKVAAWDSLLLLVALYAQAAGIIEPREALVSALPGGGEHFRLYAMLNIGALWAVALVTAAFSAVNERELRGQKIDLHQLSVMIGKIDARTDSSDIPHILLDSVCEVFGFSRGVVLASPADDLALMAFRGMEEPPTVEPGLDPVMERAWNERGTKLMKEVDPQVDRRLALLFPRAGHLLVVPLFLDRGQRLGILALEHRGRADHVRRWTVNVVEQFASHAALALQTAWLVDELQHNLEEDRALQKELTAQNLSLEVEVDERTTQLTDSLRSLRVVEEARETLLAKLVRAQEEERKRIAGDIHDDPVQKIVAAGMRLQLIRKQIGDPDVRASLDKLLESIRGSIHSLRHLIFELRPAVLEREGLGAALREHVERLDGDLRFELDDRLSGEPPGDLRVLLYRIAQEALANIRKHAQASTVRVLLTERQGGYLVEIHDDGVGFNPPEMLRSAPGHLGLSSMRERAELAGGWCKIHSLAGGGATVEIWLPAPSHTGEGSAPLADHSDADGLVGVAVPSGSRRRTSLSAS